MSIQEFQATNFTLFDKVELYGLEEGVFRIAGKHHQTSTLGNMGNNEVGKTSLLLAIAWVLLGDIVLPSGFTVKRNFNSSSTTSGLVSLRTTENVTYTIKRISRQKNPFEIMQGGRPLTEAQFLEEIGAPSMSALITAMYFNVNDNGLMRISQPALRMKFFEDLIDVSDLDAEQVRLKEEAKKVTARIDANRLRIAVLESKKHSVDPAEIVEAEAFLATVDSTLDTELQSVKATVARLQAEVDALQNDKIAVSQTKTQLVDSLAVENASLKGIERNLQTLVGVTACPTCNRGFNSPAELKVTTEGFKEQATQATNRGSLLKSRLTATELQYNAVIQKEAGLLRQIELEEQNHKRFKDNLQARKSQASAVIAKAKEAQTDVASELAQLNGATAELSAQYASLDYEASKGINLKKMARIVSTLDAIGSEVNAILNPLNLSLKVSAREVGRSGKIVLDIMPAHSPADKETPSASGDAVFDIYQIALNKAIARVLLPNLKLDFILMNEPLRSMSKPLAEQVTDWLRKLYGTVIVVVTDATGEIIVTRHANHSEVEQL